MAPIPDPGPEPQPAPVIPDPDPNPAPAPVIPDPDPNPAPAPVIPDPDPNPEPAPIIPAPAPAGPEEPAPSPRMGAGPDAVPVGPEFDSVGPDPDPDADRKVETVGLDPEQRRALEAVVLVATEPVPPSVLAQLLELPVVDIERAADALARQYEREERGYQLARVAGGYRFQSHPEAAPYVERFVLDGQSTRLSAAALETLAIIAYKQPISRAQVAAVRGVDPDAVMRTLAQRGYIEAVGRDLGPGGAVLWGTTTQFLEKLGLDSLAELPSIAGFVPAPDVVEALELGLRAPQLAAPAASNGNGNGHSNGHGHGGG